MLCVCALTLPQCRATGHGLHVPVQHTLAFQERVGFRYCMHKTQRLVIAAAWHRQRDYSSAQLQVNSVAGIGLHKGMLRPRAFIASVGAQSFFSARGADAADLEGFPTWCATFIGARPVGPQEVYDISVPGTENFLANGITVHNCYVSKSPAAPAASFLMLTTTPRLQH